MKRQLDSKYTRLVDYIVSNRDDNFLFQLLLRLRNKDTVESRIPNELNNGYADSFDFDNLIPIIADIYFDNYELQQPKHMYQLSGIGSDKGVIYLTLKNDYYTLQVWSDCTDKYQELTDEQFQEFLNQYHKFTADMFTRVEV